MKTPYSRRSFVALAASIAAQESSRGQEPKPALQSLSSKAFVFEEMPVKVSANESKSHAVFDGLTHSGFRVDVHVTELPAGTSPHPPHRHVHEEMFSLQSGVLDATVNGVTTRLTPGSVFFAHSNDEHGVVNPGPGAAVYCVTAFGRES
jgi:quercetin dioxygenase-like cupin family protein